MRFSRTICGFTVVLSIASFGLARAAYSPGSLLFTIKDPAIIESSGVAPCSCSPGVFYTHNDSPPSPTQSQGKYFVVGPSGDTLATVSVNAPNVDWEDMARGPGSDGKPALYFGDIGDNNHARGVVQIYEVPEPVIDLSVTGQKLTVTPTVHAMAFDDGPHNAETLLVHPVTGSVVIVTKETGGRSGVYVAQGPLLSGLPKVLHRVAWIDFNAIASTPLSSALLATGGAVAPDGSRFVVRTYLEAFEWPLGSLDVATALRAAPERIALPATVQGEGITYTSDSAALVTTSEGARSPVYLLPAT